MQLSLQLAIVKAVRPHVVLAAPNYTPDNWWECDLWMINRHGYATEYEIKLNKKDFYKDRAKAKNRKLSGYIRRYKKLVALKRGERCGPRYFYYATPASLVEWVLPKIPSFAGLVCIEPDGHMRIIVQAPKLHDCKAGLRDVRIAQRRLSIRYWQSLETISNLRAKHVGDNGSKVVRGTETPVCS